MSLKNKNSIEIAANCYFYKGDIPCDYHKQSGKKCLCEYFALRGKRILIIKLGAMGDVIRTTPLARRLKSDDPNCEITWITYTPEFLPKEVDMPLSFNAAHILRLLSDEFDCLYNLDKDREACALLNSVKAKIKKGFRLENGRCAPIDQDAIPKYLTGLDDDLNRINVKSYQEEMFEIVGLKFNREKYILERPNNNLKIPELPKPLIGLNTGCGGRWKTRLWAIENWIELTEKLKKEKYSVLLLGGEAEHERNRIIAEKTRANYFGYFSITDFINIVDQCDLIATGVTLAMHLAIGLEKKVIILNNTFNRNEFELYGLGKIIEPEVSCTGCFRTQCNKNCMNEITPVEVYQEINNFMNVNALTASEVLGGER